jgi:hypothetical protein
MKKRYIEEQWNEFRRSVLSKDAPQIQIDEMRKAFFAGVVALFGHVLGNLSEGNDVKEQDLQMMASIHEELEEFRDEIAVIIASQSRKVGKT